MSITQQLVDNLIACTQLDTRLVPGLQTPAMQGPIPSTADLHMIAEHVVVSNQKPAGHQDTSHARPTMLAGISSFAENVKTAWDALPPAAAPGRFASLPDAVKQDFAEWEGMIAAVALSNIYRGTGLHLSVAPMLLSADGNAAIGCVLAEMEKDTFYRPSVHGNSGKLFYVCQNGRPFAVFHPEVGLCPMQEYDSSIFEGVLPWFEWDAEDCHAGWKSILNVLEPFCVSRIAWWAGANQMMAYQNYLVGQQGPFSGLDVQLAARDSVQNAYTIDEIWPQKGMAFGTAMMAYLDQAGNACPVPDLFLDDLLISSIGTAANNRLVYNSTAGEQPIRFQNDDGLLATYVPVPPLKKGVMEVLNHCALDSMTFDAFLNSSKQLRYVRMRVTFQTPTGSLKMEKSYGCGHMQLGQMPYLMLWPFVPMPAQAQALWKSYYATWHPQTQTMMPLIGEDGRPLPFVSDKMGFSWGNQGKVHSVYRPTAANQAWPVCAGSAPFRYAVLTKTNVQTGSELEIGLVFMPNIPTIPVNHVIAQNNDVCLAVDFGTTSTVCALQAAFFNGTTQVPLAFEDYSRCVTCEDVSARATVSTMQWLGNSEGGPGWKWDKKIFSVAQLFSQNPAVINRQNQGDASKQEYYVDGRLFLSSGDVLTSLASAGAGGADPLLTQQIMNDMKFNHSMNVLNYHAASIFLAGVYMYAVLYLLKEGCIPAPGVDIVELRVSYPNEVTLQALTQNWGFARNILSGQSPNHNAVMDAQLTRPIEKLCNSKDHFYSEATAATAYLQTKNPGLYGSKLVSLDIGGGTSDISISNQQNYQNAVRNLSIRYAGREIMVSSLVELYRKINPTAPTLVDDTAFSALWTQDTQTAILCNQFNAVCTPGQTGSSVPFLHSLTSNSTLRMCVEMLLAKNMHLGAAADLNPTNLLRQLISMKFIMLLHVVAQAVRENIDMWIDPRTGRLGLVGKYMDINLSVSGTGAQLLQYVFDCPMERMEDLRNAANVRDPQMAQCLNLLNTIFYEELKDQLGEGNSTRLNILVDYQNVTQKMDVCYGMLNQSINNLVAAQPGGPVEIQAGFNAANVQLNQNLASGEENERIQKQYAMRQRISDFPLSDEKEFSLEKYIDGVRDAQGNIVKHGLIDYWRWYEQIYFPAPISTNRGLGPNVNVMTSLMNKEFYSQYFTAARSLVASERAAFMIEPEQAPYVDQLTGMYLVEELLDWLIAQNQ